MRAAAAAISLLILTVPAPAFDPVGEPAKPEAAKLERSLQVGAALAELRARQANAPEKIQDRIAPGAPLRLAFVPELRLAPKAEPAPPAKSPYGWSAALDAQIARHAMANGVPMELARRVVKRESGGNPRAVSKGNYGLMQIRLGTAKAMGYKGGAKGLLDADTNMTYAMRYLAGALRAAKGDHDRAIRLYARGYYPEAKKMGFSPYDPPRAAGLAPVTTAR
jgi:soluble lytic murein transglycosylase-like protein